MIVNTDIQLSLEPATLYGAKEEDMYDLLMGDCREGDPIDLDDYFMDDQDQWITDENQAKLWDKSRRIGATYAESYRACRKRNKSKERRHYYFSSADESSALEYAEYCRQWCKLLEAVVKQLLETYEESDGNKYNNYIIEFPDGSRINCMTSNPKRFRSKGGDVCLDEYDWHDKPQAMYDAASPATTWGYDICLLTTRSAEGSHFDNLASTSKKVIRGETTFEAENELEWSYHRTTIIGAIQRGLAEKIFKLKSVSFAARWKLFKQCRARSRDADAFGREYLCVPSAEAVTLISYDLYRSCQSADCIQPLVMHTEGSRDYYVGFDVGREKHQTVIWTWEQLGDILICRKVERMVKAPYGTQLQVLSDLLANHNVRRVCGDATGIGDMLVETLQERHGSTRVEKVKFTAPIKEHLASLMLQGCQDRTLRLPDDLATRESFHKIRKTVTATGNVRYDAATTETGHADDFWGAALGKEASTTNVVPRCILL
jgi:phage FluMu gp28-like protein